MNGMQCKHFHRGTLLMAERMTPGSAGCVVEGDFFCVEGLFFFFFFFLSAFEGAVSAHFP